MNRPAGGWLDGRACSVAPKRHPSSIAGRPHCLRRLLGKDRRRTGAARPIRSPRGTTTARLPRLRLGAGKWALSAGRWCRLLLLAAALAWFPPLPQTPRQHPVDTDKPSPFCSPEAVAELPFRFVQSRRHDSRALCGETSLVFLPSPASSTPSPLLWALPPQPSRLPHADPQTCKRSRSRPGRLEGRLPLLLPTSVKSRTAAVRTAVTGSWVLPNFSPDRELSRRHGAINSVLARRVLDRLRPPRRILPDTTIPIAGTRYMRKSDTYTYWITNRNQQQKSAPRRRIPWQTHAAKRSIHQLGTPLARLASPCSAWRPTQPPLVASSAR